MAARLIIMLHNQADSQVSKLPRDILHAYLVPMLLGTTPFVLESPSHSGQTLSMIDGHVGFTEPKHMSTNRSRGRRWHVYATQLTIPLLGVDYELDTPTVRQVICNPTHAVVLCDSARILVYYIARRKTGTMFVRHINSLALSNTHIFTCYRHKNSHLLQRYNLQTNERVQLAVRLYMGTRIVYANEQYIVLYCSCGVTYDTLDGDMIKSVKFRPPVLHFTKHVTHSANGLTAVLYKMDDTHYIAVYGATGLLLRTYQCPDIDNISFNARGQLVYYYDYTVYGIA